jgi:hypothetical protein
MLAVPGVEVGMAAVAMAWITVATTRLDNAACQSKRKQQR